MRAANILRSLTALGDVDLYCLLEDRALNGQPPPEDLGVRRVRMQRRPTPSATQRRLDWVRPGGAPRGIGGWRGALHDDLCSWAAPSYDAIWVVRAQAFAATGPLLPAGPVLLDLDDLNDLLSRGERAAATSAARRWASTVDARRWRLYQHRLASSVAVVVVCSELDRSRLGLGNVAVVANGYDDRPPVVRRPVHDPPTLLLQGALQRPPLVDAASRLAREVLPRVRARHPSARLLLVGPVNETVTRLGELPGVTVVGAVPDMTPWLEAADVVAVPMGWGSGTRIKIIEAFACGIPVVATTVAAEGLDAVDRMHLIVEDELTSFADACCQVLTDADLRSGLVTEARALFDARFRWTQIRAQISDLTTRVGAGAGIGSPT